MHMQICGGGMKVPVHHSVGIHVGTLTLVGTLQKPNIHCDPGGSLLAV